MDLPVFSRKMQSTVTAIISGVDVTASDQKQPGGFEVTLPDRIVEGAKALSYRLVYLEEELAVFIKFCRFTIATKH